MKIKLTAIIIWKYCKYRTDRMLMLLLIIINTRDTLMIGQIKQEGRPWHTDHKHKRDTHDTTNQTRRTTMTWISLFQQKQTYLVQAHLHLNTTSYDDMQTMGLHDTQPDSAIIACFRNWFYNEHSK